VKGKSCLIIDDIIDTAGTLVKTVDALYDAGAASVYAAASHAVLSRSGHRPHRQFAPGTGGGHQHHSAARGGAEVAQIKVLSIAGLLGAAIESIHMETSVSTLFS